MNDELEKLTRLLAEARAARAACTVDAPESVWQVKDQAEAAWDSATNYADPDAAVNALAEMLAKVKRLEAELEAARVHAWLNDELQEKATSDEPN